MSKALLVPFFPGHGLQKTAFFNDVTITSSLRSVVQVLIRHFTIFQSHRLQMICAKNCEKLSEFVEVSAKILPAPFFLGHSV